MDCSVCHVHDDGDSPSQRHQLLWWLYDLRHADEPLSCARAHALSNRSSFFSLVSCAHLPTLTRAFAACADLTFHSIAGMLLAICVINKGHYLYLWYITGFFSGPQLLADAYVFMALLLVGRKRRW